MSISTSGGSGLHSFRSQMRWVCGMSHILLRRIPTAKCLEIHARSASLTARKAYPSSHRSTSASTQRTRRRGQTHSGDCPIPLPPPSPSSHSLSHSSN